MRAQPCVPAVLCGLGQVTQPLWVSFPNRPHMCSRALASRPCKAPPPWSRQAFLFTRGPSRGWEAAALASSAPRFLPLPLQHASGQALRALEAKT